MKTASELTELFIQQHPSGIKKTNVNWESDSSPIAFDWRYEFLAAHDLWLPTKNETLLDMLIDAVDWVFGMMDCNLPADFGTDVITKWGNPNQTQWMSLPQMGYGKSPRKKLGPVWCRYIDTGGQMEFRPEILTDGCIGYALVCFFRDAMDYVDVGWELEKLETLKHTFLFHDPSWNESYQPPDGESFGKPHKRGEITVSAYAWPKGIEVGSWGHIPGTNQHSQMLSFGVVLEGLLDEFFGAGDKMQAFIDNTLPHLIKIEGDRLLTGYDLRAHSTFSPAMNEMYSDANHHCKACPLFFEAEGLNILPPELQDQIINQTLQVTHQGGGRMAICVDGTSDHENGDHANNPGMAHLADALLFDNGYRLLEIAEDVLMVDCPEPSGPKPWHYHARVARALHERETDPAKADKPHDMPMSNADPTPQDSIPWSPPADVKQPDKPALKKSEAQAVGQGESEKRKEAKSGALPASDPARCFGPQRVKVGQRIQFPGTGDFDRESAANVKHHVTPDSAASITNTWPLMEVEGLKPCQALLTYVTKDGERKVEFEVVA